MLGGCDNRCVKWCVMRCVTCFALDLFSREISRRAASFFFPDRAMINVWRASSMTHFFTWYFIMTHPDICDGSFLTHCSMWYLGVQCYFFHVMYFIRDSLRDVRWCVSDSFKYMTWFIWMYDVDCRNPPPLGGFPFYYVSSSTIYR